MDFSQTNNWLTVVPGKKVHPYWIHWGKLPGKGLFVWKHEHGAVGKVYRDLLCTRGAWSSPSNPHLPWILPSVSSGWNQLPPAAIPGLFLYFHLSGTFRMVITLFKCWYQWSDTDFRQEEFTSTAHCDWARKKKTPGTLWGWCLSWSSLFLSIFQQCWKRLLPPIFTKTNRQKLISLHVHPFPNCHSQLKPCKTVLIPAENTEKEEEEDVGHK